VSTESVRRCTVLCRKRPGCDVVFTITDEETAAGVVKQLMRFGLAARVVPAIGSDVPGIQRRTSRTRA
jgi:hypothetical protein